jgi:hypothetical protein
MTRAITPRCSTCRTIRLTLRCRLPAPRQVWEVWRQPRGRPAELERAVGNARRLARTAGLGEVSPEGSSPSPGDPGHCPDGGSPAHRKPVGASTRWAALRTDSLLLSTGNCLQDIGPISQAKKPQHRSPTFANTRVRIFELVGWRLVFFSNSAVRPRVAGV